MKKKKTPYDLHEQMVRITDYLIRNFWENGRLPRKTKEKVKAKVNKIYAIYYRYVNNIYKLHNVDLQTGGVTEFNNIWFYAYHAKEEYM